MTRYFGSCSHVAVNIQPVFDPNANLSRQERIMRIARLDLAPARQRELRELREALAKHLSANGVEPIWASCPRASQYWEEEAAS